MSQKHLSRTLEKLQDFKEPKIQLEQYITPSDIASELLWSLNLRGHIKNKEIIDLGAGTGILGIGALLLGAKKVTFLEKDKDAIEILKQNLKRINIEFEISEYEIINEDITNITGRYDVAVMNPPFGTKTKRIDTIFLEKAFTLSNIITSIHKTSTKEYIKKTYKDNKYEIIEIFDFNYALKKIFEHHKKLVKKIEVSGFFCKKIQNK
jgi:putative methylase